MDNFTFSEIAGITGGVLVNEKETGSTGVTSVITDSRYFFRPDESIFFALKGPRNNGHNFIPELTEKGIRKFVVSEFSSVRQGAAFILVKDTTEALQRLAALNRKKYHYPVIGITGSNGKTIVKEWLYDLLSDEYRIVRSPKSYNSQVGVPLSVLLMNGCFNLGIFEAGISLPGEMGKLSEIIRPELGIFTNIGDAHQENFSNIPEKIREKLELFARSEKLVFSVDTPVVKKETEAFCRKHSVKMVTWSLKGNPAQISFSPRKQENVTQISARVNQKMYTFTIPFTDSSSIENACHCFAAIVVFTDHPETLTDRFERLAPVAMRLEINKGIHHCLLINDYYNSDLNSLSIALSVLQQQAAKEHLEKHIILSDIQQSGFPGPELYRRVNELLLEWKIDKITGIGPEISANSSAFSIQKKFYPSTGSFLKDFQRNYFQFSVILIKGARSFTFEKISSLLQQQAHQTVLEISLSALVHNLNVFRASLNPGTKIMVMVKAFSYGSGDVEIAKMLQYQQVDYLAVAVADEGVQLRNAGIQIPIIVMNPEIHSFQNMLDYRLEPNLYSLELLKSFSKSVSINALTGYPVHLKLDTGMNRLGLKTESETEAAINHIISDNTLKISSVFTHLAASDEPGQDGFTLSQFDVFDKWYNQISTGFGYQIDRHILNSAGIERFPEKQYEMVRLGIGLYGVSVTGLPLHPIGTLKSVVSQLKFLKPGETVGYGRKGKPKSGSEIAIVPLGYADGLDRKLGNGNGSAFIRGKRVPIIGNICMDMLMLDVSGLGVKTGDEAEFFGPNISITDVAEKAGTIPYEILTGISQRVKRIYLQE